MTKIRKAAAVMAALAAATPLLAAQAYAQARNPLLPQDLSPWGMFLGADIVVKVVMVGLAFASLITWTICVAKMLELRGATRRARRRIEALGNDLSLAEAERSTREGDDAVALLVQAAATEASLSDTTADESFKERVQLRLDRIEAAMARRIARGTGVLATIGATAPFVGLFGTVWGIMTSFQSIAASKNTSLAVVAPGIAEALFATALGLVAAIPATIFYNKFSSEVSRIAQRLEGFADEFSAILSRQVDERS